MLDERGVTPPADFVIQVACSNGSATTTTAVTVPGTGGPGTPIVEFTAGAACAIAEDTSALPPGWVLTHAVDGRAPSFTPPIGVLTAGDTITVTVTNDPAPLPPSPSPPAPPDPSSSSPSLSSSASRPPGTPRGELPVTGCDGTITLLWAAGGLIAVGSHLTRQRRRRRDSPP